ncbi:MAG: DUF547 domain-containing protein [Nitrospina sp.]|jgi:hypothetical protein|nr:DUF547 domain-containing protein [Nitrospina sp.]MBT3508806.1 DUF547 domain-containing protein [Nitrospina sp.]MBT3874562.1 DUF547 domain-containing protein [Nitrospina sp.]MBT4047036.1 DUF547 domain-containing protein [Nitrospina sp.]MBT4557942.1 DUF547 domain-containing protein [Nitrospina sp.]
MRDIGLFRHLQVLLLGVFFVFSYSSNIEAFDFSDWDTLVKKYVAPKTLDGVLINAIDYDRLKKDSVFLGLASRLKDYPLENLQSQESRLTFWINVYNILAAKMITDHYPIESIKDVGSIFKSVWKRPAGNVGGEERTLNDIEHEILRKMDEPRIHVAIVCASVSCPDLRPESYKVEKLSDQLDDQMKKFLLSREKGMKLDEKKNRVYLSSIFKWFADDFESRGGVLKFISQYVSPEERKVLSNSKIKISYLDYNWRINGH